MSIKTYHLHEFFNFADGHSLIVDTSAGLVLGPLPGLEHFNIAVAPILPLVDGLLASPGQARKLSGHMPRNVALLIRADWTNALRPSDFVLPLEKVSHISLITPQDAINLGVSAMVLHFLLGHEEQIEADCLRTIVQFAIQGRQVDLPLLVDVQPIGPRVVLRSKAIELGVSYALEGGADGVAIPWPGRESFETIRKMTAEMPVWVKPTTIESTTIELTETIELGGAGLWLDERIYAQPDPLRLLETYRSQLHPSMAAGQA